MSARGTAGHDLSLDERLAIAGKFLLDLAVEKRTGDVEFLVRDDDPVRDGTWRVYRSAGRR